MAPPPSASLPLTERLKQLATTLQFAWFVGHLTLLLSVFRYSFSYITFNYFSRWAQFSYRLAFIAAAATYGIVVYKAHKARFLGSKQPPPKAGLWALISDENVQYLFMALIWLYSRQIPLALLPFTVYSVFHTATYTRTNLLPTLQPGSKPSGPTPTQSPASPRPTTTPSPLASSIGKFVKEYYDTSMTLVALLEISLWFRVFLSALTFSRGSWVLLIVYTVFLRARYAQSHFVQDAFTQFAARIDAQVLQQSMPAGVRQGWETFKGLTRKGVEATDLRRFGAPQGGKKPM